MDGLAFALGLLAAAVAAFVIEPPWKMSGLILFTWWLGLLTLSTIANVGGLQWLGTRFGSELLFIAGALTLLFALTSIEILRRGKRQKESPAVARGSPPHS